MELEVNIKKKLKEFDLDIEFGVSKGCTGLMGSSGSGKSMILKCIAGIEKPDSGRIVLNGNILYDSAKKINLSPQKRHVGYLFQSYALFPNMTVLKNIEEGAGASGFSKKEDIARAFDMLERFHIKELSDRYPRQLSGGQKQRAALARLMVCDPDVILLDEPFSALDDELKSELIDEMKGLLGGLQKPEILVSHNKDEVAELCGSIYKIHKGRLIR